MRKYIINLKQGLFFSVVAKMIQMEIKTFNINIVYYFIYKIVFCHH